MQKNGDCLADYSVTEYIYNINNELRSTYVR